MVGRRARVAIVGGLGSVIAIMVAAFAGIPSCTRPDVGPDPADEAGEPDRLAPIAPARLAALREHEHERAALARTRRLTDLAFALPDGGDLRIEEMRTDEAGITHATVQVTVGGVPLHGLTWMEHVSPRDEIEQPSILAGWSTPVVKRSSAAIDADGAARAARAALGDQRDLRVLRNQLFYDQLNPAEPWRLVYIVTTLASDTRGEHAWRQIVDAEQGQVLDTVEETPARRSRQQVPPTP